MNIAIVQTNVITADFSGNAQKIIDAAMKAYAEGADVVVFPELVLSGGAAQDLYLDQDFLDCSARTLQELTQACPQVSCIVGAVMQQGQHLENAAYLLQDGKVELLTGKAHLGYEEQRYFKSGKGLITCTIKGKPLALAIGEDAYATRFIDSPVDAVLILHNQAFSYITHPSRHSKAAALAQKNNLPVLQISMVGGYGDTLYAGSSMVFDAQSTMIDQAPAFEEAMRFYQLEGKEIKPLQTSNDRAVSITEILHDALLMGIRDFFAKQGFTQAIVGLSGGLDSALVASLACAALGSENVHCILMPSQYSTEHSVSDAQSLVDNLGCKQTILPIQPVFESFKQTLAELFKGLPFGLAEENLQARTRGSLIMAISNKLGGIALNTSNKSEAAMGYGTLYGDLVGALSVIGDVYKTQAYDIARFINREQIIIPEHILTKAPSAELRPGQKDSDSLPEYDLLDPILFQYVDLRKSVSEICKMGYDRALVLKITQAVDRMEFKRHQTPPVLCVSSRPFGKGLKLPEVKRSFLV